MRHPGLAGLGLATALVCGACQSPDPKALLDVADVETYWAVDPSSGAEQYIAPVVRFHVRNKGDSPLGSVQATAVFRQVGEDNVTWGSAFTQVASRRETIPRAGSALVVLKSDSRYHSTGTPGSMFQHTLFKDAVVEYFLRVGASGWVSFGKLPIERRIGAREVTGFVPSPQP